MKTALPYEDIHAQGLRPSFELRHAQPLAAPVLFASPHSGSFYPKDFQDNLQVPLIDLRRTEDAFIDEVFASCVAQGAHQLCANYGRSYVDLNRDARELDTNMFVDGTPLMTGMQSARVKAGLGSLPRVAASGQDISAVPITKAEGAFRLRHVHEAYHGTLSAELNALKNDWADIVLIDCHSMPSKQPGRSGLPDIVLGDRFGSSCSARLTSRVERCFRRSGLTVTRNAPYAGGYTTRRYGRPKRGVHALQIEINRGLYLDEANVAKSHGFEALQAQVNDVIGEILSFALYENS
jgi:N-formylglutamate amidohydrolase